MAFLFGLPLAGQPRDSVWVNARSGVYHCPGTEHFGRTAQGEFLGESVARQRGFRANGGRLCHEMPPVDTGAPTPGSAAMTPCAVIRVIDGDTLECAPVGRVRLIGIDSPEAGEGAAAVAATRALAGRLPPGTRVQLEDDVELHDRYRRRLAWIWSEGQLVNREMVRDGWALSYRYPPNLRHAAAVAGAQWLARRDGRGLWGSGGFRCPPARPSRSAC